MWGADRTKADGINMFRFGIPGYRIFIKVDKKSLKPGVQQACLAPNQPLAVILSRMDIGRPYEILKAVFANEKLSKQLMRQKHRRDA
jgi:hypothetical protein